MLKSFCEGTYLLIMPDRNREAYHACMDLFFLDGLFTAGETVTAWGISWNQCLLPENPMKTPRR